MLSSAYVWAKVLGQLESKMPSISTWFDDCEVVELTGQTLILFTPTEFRREFIETKAAGYIQDAIRELFSMEITVQVLGEQEKRELEQKKIKDDPILFNPQFTFENFVVGASNRFAHAAALAVAQQTRPPVTTRSTSTVRPALARRICSMPLPTRFTVSTRISKLSTSKATSSPTN